MIASGGPTHMTNESLPDGSSDPKREERQRTAERQHAPRLAAPGVVAEPERTGSSHTGGGAEDATRDSVESGALVVDPEGIAGSPRRELRWRQI